MNRKIRLSTAISYVIIAVAILAALCVWPLKLIHRNTVSKSDGVVVTESSICDEEHIIAQVFVAKGTILKTLDVYVCNDMSGEDIKVTMYDGTLTQVYSKELTVKDTHEFPGFLTIPINCYTERGSAYILSIAGIDTPVIVGLEDHASTTNPDIFAITYDGVEDPDHNIFINYEYAIDFNWWQIIAIDVLLLVIAVALSYILEKILKKNEKELSVQKLLQVTLNPLIILLSMGLLILVFPCRTFSDKPVNIIFWYLGILITAVLALYEVNYKRSTDKNIGITDFVKNHGRGLITAIAIGHVLWYCFEYMNGFYDIHHTYAVRRVLVWFIFTLIFTFEKEEFCKIYNLIWLIIGGPIMYFYSKPYIGSGEQELEYILNAHIIYFGIFLCMNVVYNAVRLIRKKIKLPKWNLVFFIPFAILLIWQCILANTRQWPGFMTLLVVFLLFRLAVWKDRDKWLEYLCNGVIINFLFMMVFSLLHRPYYGYIYHRYNMSYFTVTMTATHLTLCLAACLVKLYVKNKTCTDKRELIPWLILMGIVANYQIFTLSRTGYVSVAIMFVIALAVIVLVDAVKGQRLYKFVLYSLALLASVVVLFAPVSTLTRIIPTLYDDPVIYEYEPCIVTAYKGTAPNYRHYMDLPRFIEVFASKVLGIGDATAKADNIFAPTGIHSNEYTEYAYAGTGMIMYDSEDIDIPEEEDVSNGRVDIYRSYIEQLNLWGHDTMGAILKDGSEAAHAHNVLLQVMFDHGIVYGIYFAVFMIFAMVYCLIYFIKIKDSNQYSLLPFTLIVGFLVAGIVEWIYHSCNPFGLTMILAISSLVFKCEKND